jgi:hypothetical protein
MKAPTYRDDVKALRMTATRDSVAGGHLEIQAENDDVLVRFDLSAAGGTVSSATWTIQFGSDSNSQTKAAIAGGGGTDATKARLVNSASSAHLITGLSVGTNSTNGVQIDNVSIATGQDVTISAATIVHAVNPA